MIRRDYIERLIERCAQALAQIARLVSSGQYEPALEVIKRAREELLGPLGPLLERLDARTAVELAGRHEIDRIRMYAALTCEEAAVHEARGEGARADALYRRGLELYEVGASAGARLLPADHERIAMVRTRLAAR